MADAVFREPNSEEKKDFINIDPNLKGQRPEDTIRQQLLAKEAIFSSKGKPYCFACAWIDAQDLLEKAYKEAGRAKGDAVKTLGERLTKQFDMDKYAEPSYFKELQSTEAKEPVRVGNRTIMEKVGDFKNFQCKERGHGKALFVPLKA